MSSETDSTEPSPQPPDPPGPTSDEPEPPRVGPDQAPDGALTAAGAWALVSKTIF
jgi:hypothetical protein